MIGHQEINCRIIFYVHMNFQQRVRFVSGGHTTEVPNSITYSSVVSRESIHIDFLLSSLHIVGITTIDMDNSYLNAPCAEKIWFVGGDE